MDKNKKMIIGILTAAIVLVVAFIVYITCFDSHIEFSSKFKNGITVEYGKKFEAPKIKAYVRGRLINRKGKEIKCTIDSNVDATKTGSYEIKVTAQYGKKTATQTIKVEVRDKKAPEITLNGDAEMTVEAGSEFSDPGYTATDNYDGDLTDKVSVTGAVDTSKPGDYEIKYSVADSSKNESEVKRTVHVTDTTAPQIKLSGDDFMSVKKGDKYSDPGYTATDNCDGDITDSVKVSGDKVDKDKAGKYTVTYEVSDSSGKEMKAWFQGGEMRKVDVIGSVRLVYYPMESDSTLIGMNVSETSLLNMFLENRKMKKMIMSPKSNGTLYPMLQRPPEKMKLDNFVWFDYIRPLDKEDIFEWRGKKAGQELKKSNRSAVPLPNHNLFNKKK